MKVVWGFIIWGNFSREQSGNKVKAGWLWREPGTGKSVSLAPSLLPFGSPLCDFTVPVPDTNGVITSEPCSRIGIGKGKYLALLALKPEGTVCGHRALDLVSWCLRSN